MGQLRNLPKRTRKPPQLDNPQKPQESIKGSEGSMEAKAHNKNAQARTETGLNGQIGEPQTTKEEVTFFDGSLEYPNAPQDPIETDNEARTFQRPKTKKPKTKKALAYGCLRCGNKLTAGQKRYCSDSCKSMMHKRRLDTSIAAVRKCAVCGTDIVHLRPQARTCSPACKQTAYRKRH